MAAPIHRDAVLLDVVETEAPRSPEQVEADRRLPGDDLPIAALSDRPRSTELKAMMAWPRHDVHDAADGIRTDGCRRAARQHLDAIDESDRQCVEIDRGVGTEAAVR